ncbi:hypothetical protein BC828DRAFT_372369 [Blastocladiella britannica]|nr:hypothetical protein BC828DRAFT_372369 [Blastocladiella britannica]
MSRLTGCARLVFIPKHIFFAFPFSFPSSRLHPKRTSEEKRIMPAAVSTTRPNNSNKGAKLQFGRTDSAAISTRDQRRNATGIDCMDAVSFTLTTTGSECTKALVLRNVTARPLSLRYTPPTRYLRDRVFLVDFPTTMSLSPGMSISVPVTFVPKSKVAYTDELRFCTQASSSASAVHEFSIGLRAVLPDPVLTVLGVDTASNSPERRVLDFGLCALNQPMTRVLTFKNTGIVPCTFECTAAPIASPNIRITSEGDTNPDPSFTWTPATASLAPGQTCPVTMTYTPARVVAHMMRFICNYWEAPAAGSVTEGNSKVFSMPITLDGAGKLARVNLAMPGSAMSALSHINAGDFSPGNPLKVHLLVVNPSLVRSNYVLRPASGGQRDGAPFCSFSRHRGSLAPGAAAEVVLTIHRACNDPWLLEVPGSPVPPTRIMVCARSVGPCISVHPEILAWGDVQVGSPAVVKVVHVQNAGSVPAFVQLMGLSGPSKFTLASSDAEAASRETNIFAIAAGSDTIEIPPRSEVPVQISFAPGAPIGYWKRVQVWAEHAESVTLDLVGTGFAEDARPPSLQARHIEAYLLRRDIGLGLLGPEHLNHLLRLGTLRVAPNDVSRVLWADPESRPPMPSDPQEEIATLSTSSIDFGNCSQYRFIEPRSVTLTNHMASRVSVYWRGPTAQGVTVEPAMVADLAPGAVATFRVMFQPRVADTVVLARWECAVVPRAMRSFRMVASEASYVPGGMFDLHVVGNTLSAQLMTNKLDIVDGHRLEVPPATILGDAVRHTVRIANRGDCPAQFSLILPSHQGDNAGWSISPSSGAIAVGGSQLVQVQLNPRALPPVASIVHVPVTIAVNGSLSNAMKMTLHSQICKPCVSVLPSAAFTIAPTLVGLPGSRTCTLQSESEVPCQYSWHIPAAYESTLQVHPAAGTLSPRASAKTTLVFHAMTPGQLLIPVTLVTRNEGSSFESRLPVMVGVTAVVGALQPRQSRVRLAPALICSHHVTGDGEIVVYNPTDCAVTYRVRLVGENGHTNRNLSRQVRIPDQVHRVPAHCSQTIRLELFLQETRDVQFNIQLALGTTDDVWHDFWHITAVGIFPKLEIIRVSGNTLTSFDLQKSCNIAAVNHALRLGVSKKIIDVVFAPCLMGASDSTVEWVLRNTGPVELHWALSTPQDPVAIGDSEKAPIKSYSDSRVFAMSMRKGHLVPGEVQRLVFTCSHRVAGTHEQAIQFHVKSGPECDGTIPLLLSSTTLTPRQGWLFHAGSILAFGEASIAGDKGVIQHMILRNMGDARLWFELSCGDIAKFLEENDQVPIFHLTQTHGSIPAGETCTIPIRFSPNRVQPYSMPITVSMSGGNMFSVTLVGRGVAPMVSLPASQQQGALVPRHVVGKRAAADTPDRSHHAKLDYEELVLGKLPVRSLATRVIVLTNPGPTSVSYMWRATAQTEEVVRIIPPLGTLAPGEAALVRVFVKTGREVGRMAHMFECLVASTQRALQQYVAGPQKSAAAQPAQRSSPHRTTSSLGRYNAALPSIGAPPVQKLELAVHLDTVLESAESTVLPRYVPAAVESDDPWGGAAWCMHNSSSTAMDTIGSVLRASLDDVFAEMEHEDTLTAIHAHADWHFPKPDGCPADVLQDVLEGVLFAVLSEVHGGAGLPDL